MIIDTHIAGVPCKVELLSWEKHYPATREYEAEGGCGEWRVLDRAGKPAPWLQSKLTARDEQRIDYLFFQQMEKGEAYDD